MTSAHGNKVLVGTICVCLISLMILSAQIISSRKSKMQLCEKEFAKAVYALEASNQESKK